MEQWTAPDSGSLRLTNPKTLQKWKDNGKFQELLDEGYIYAKGCGRFRMFLCTCYKCRNKKILQETI